MIIVPLLIFPFIIGWPIMIYGFSHDYDREFFIGVAMILIPWITWGFLCR